VGNKLQSSSNKLRYDDTLWSYDDCADIDNSCCSLWVCMF